MDEKKNQLIALGTFLFILAILLLNWFFSETHPPPGDLPSFTENFPTETSSATLEETPWSTETVSPVNALPTDSEIQDTIADWNRKQQILEKRAAEKAKKAANVMAIAREEKPAPPNPWKKNTSPPVSPDGKTEEKSDSVPYEDLRDGIKSHQYFVH